jgi:hypothetical protein
MLCYSKAKGLGSGVDTTCLTKAQTRADAAINRAGSACDGSASNIDAAVDGCVSTFLTDDPGDGACPAGSARTIGTGVKRELGCQTRDVTTPGTFATCDMDEDTKTTAALGRAGRGTPCVTATSIITDIDNCDTALDDLVTGTCGGVHSGLCLQRVLFCAIRHVLLPSAGPMSLDVPHRRRSDKSAGKSPANGGGPCVCIPCTSPQKDAKQKASSATARSLRHAACAGGLGSRRTNQTLNAATGTRLTTRPIAGLARGAALQNGCPVDTLMPARSAKT